MFAQGHNTATRVGLEPPTSGYGVRGINHQTTAPLCCLWEMVYGVAWTVTKIKVLKCFAVHLQAARINTHLLILSTPCDHMYLAHINHCCSQRTFLSACRNYQCGVCYVSVFELNSIRNYTDFIKMLEIKQKLTSSFDDFTPSAIITRTLTLRAEPEVQRRFKRRK